MAGKNEKRIVEEIEGIPSIKINGKAISTNGNGSRSLRVTVGGEDGLSGLKEVIKSINTDRSIQCSLLFARDEFGQIINDDEVWDIHFNEAH